MGERKIALIPNVVVQGALGPKNYGILITDERSIFITQRSSTAMIGSIIRGAIGAAIMESVATDREVDYLHEPVERLAAMKGTISVSHASLLSILVERSSRYTILESIIPNLAESGRSRRF